MKGRVMPLKQVLWQVYFPGGQAPNLEAVCLSVWGGAHMKKDISGAFLYATTSSIQAPAGAEPAE